MIVTVLFATALVAAQPQVASSLAPGADHVRALRRIQCHDEDGRPVVYHWSGRAWSRRPGERDRPLFDVEGMNVRACATVSDDARGTGFRMVSREIMLYLDPRSGEIVDRWTNPWTEEEVEVVHVANDPVNNGPFLPESRFGAFDLGLETRGGRGTLSFTVPLFYPSPLGGDYQEWVGGEYHAMEIFDFFFDLDLVTAVEQPDAEVEISWSRISPWLPWMRMGSRPGLMVFHATGARVGGIEELPSVLRDALRERFPIWMEPPPLDDERPNATTWTVFRDWADARSGEAEATPGTD